MNMVSNTFNMVDREVRVEASIGEGVVLTDGADGEAPTSTGKFMILMFHVMHHPLMLSDVTCLMMCCHKNVSSKHFFHFQNHTKITAAWPSP